jgi:hypothetical protein
MADRDEDGFGLHSLSYCVVCGAETRLLCTLRRVRLSQRRPNGCDLDGPELPPDVLERLSTNLEPFTK